MTERNEAAAVPEKEYETVIGLEVHVELATQTKIFCSCSTEFGGEPNTHICPVCAGMPGSLPVLNRKVAEFAAAAGFALGCRIAGETGFDRKNYFYPDNPQNYQISQLYVPMCRDGAVTVRTEEGEKRIRIHEIHMEEDAGKLIHQEEENCTLVDYNRSGVPLIEIVSEPDMRSAQEAVAYLEKIKTTLKYIGVSDCRMEEGSMRADVNLSVRKAGDPELGVRTEMKNLNSFRAVARAIEAESERQREILARGGGIAQETRRWDDQKGCSYTMRGKEDARDYRYFPEPDLPPVVFDREWTQRIRGELPELREEKAERFKREYGLPDYDIRILTQDRALADLFEETAAVCGRPKKVSNWLMVEAMRLLRERGMEPEEIRFSPGRLAKLIELAEKHVITGTTAKEVFEVMFDGDVDPAEYVKERGLGAVADEGAVRETALRVMEENPQSVSDYLSGKKKAVGYLVGQTMGAMKGRADPGTVNRIIGEELARREAK